jgi:hypothetical protein
MQFVGKWFRRNRARKIGGLLDIESFSTLANNLS